MDSTLYSRIGFHRNDDRRARAMLKFLGIASIMALTIPMMAQQREVAPPVNEEAACRGLLEMPNLTITSATLKSASGSTPQHCYIQGMISGRIRFHMQLPLRTSWNGRLLNIGDGGKDGILNFDGNRLAQGYAVANSNSGHDGAAEPGSSFGWNNLNAVIDFGYRAVHLTANASKAVVRFYYGQSARYTYFEGCSNGGRQGLMEAQRFPGDFDGIVAGAPFVEYSAVNMMEVWMAQKIFQDNLAGNLAFDKDGDGIPESLTKWEILRGAVLAKCDEKDGIKDGVIDNPLRCDFKPEADLARWMCAGDVNADGCFTRRQLQTVQHLYQGAIDSKGVQVSKGYALGSEWSWNSRFIAHKGNNLSPTRLGNSDDHVNFLFYANSPGLPVPVVTHPSQTPYTVNKNSIPPEFAWWEFNIDDVSAGKGNLMKSILDPTDPDLTGFLQRENGKLLLYQGWADDIPTGHTLDYYNSVIQATFRGNLNAAREKVRLFMVPGMGHCRGGPGCDTWDRLAPLVDWVENGKTPAYVVAEHLTSGRVDNQRKVCVYPQQAVYVGPAGGQNNPANWVEQNFACR